VGTQRNTLLTLIHTFIGREFFDQWRQNIVRYVPHELLDGPERLMARRASGNRYAMLRIHEGGEIVPADFGLKGAEKVGFFHRRITRKATITRRGEIKLEYMDFIRSIPPRKTLVHYRPRHLSALHHGRDDEHAITLKKKIHQIVRWRPEASSSPIPAPPDNSRTTTMNRIYVHVSRAPSLDLVS
jgi:hypothetical protein